MTLGFEENSDRFMPPEPLPLTDAEAIKAVYLAPRFLHDVLKALQRLDGAHDVIEELLSAYVPTILGKREWAEDLDDDGHEWTHESLDCDSYRQNSAIGLMLKTIYCRCGITEEMVDGATR